MTAPATIPDPDTARTVVIDAAEQWACAILAAQIPAAVELYRWPRQRHAWTLLQPPPIDRAEAA